MSNDASRRRVLLAGATALTMAGCMGGDDPDDRDAGGADDDDESDENDPDLEIRPPGIEHGDVIDDFEDIDGWSYGVGEVSADDSDPILGTQSMHLESPEGGDRVDIYRDFDDPLDLDGRHLSMAVKVNTQGPARVRLDLFAPDRHNMLRADRRIGRGLDDWMRIDVGYTNWEGEPDPAAVEEIRLRVDNLNGESIECWCDDLRATDAADEPRAVLLLNNARHAYYEEVFPTLRARADPAVVPVWRSGVEGSGRLGVDQLRSMRDAGWDIISRPTADAPLPDLDDDEQRSVIEDNQAYLVGRGFEDGARHFVAPGYRMNAETLSIVRDVHETGITFGGCPNANPPATRHTAAVFNGDSGDSTSRLLELAATYDQSVILAFSRIAEGTDFDMDDFTELLDELDEHGFEIVTLSDLFDG